jgi:ABC-type branched-subunit amino acid transport system ATPase component
MERAGGDAVLSVRGLTRRYGGVVAVSDVDLDIAPGERRAVHGTTSAGKTTRFDSIT